MADLNQTVLEVVNHLLTRHPELAPVVERLAAQAQGKSMQDLDNFNEWKRYENQSVEQIFTSIYANRTWGASGEQGQPFFSGSGSHSEAIVTRYVEAVRAFLATLPGKPDVVDLGCGDFNVGSRIRPYCGRYVACDVVRPLVAHNQEAFRGLDVDFRELDMTAEELPAGDVVFIRQVLQHLSNSKIAAVVEKVRRTYRYLVLTEHLPTAGDFPANLDKPTGHEIRMKFGSGVVLTAEPFNLRPLAEQVICEVGEFGGVIRTTAYQLA